MVFLVSFKRLLLPEVGDTEDSSQVCSALLNTAESGIASNGMYGIHVSDLFLFYFQ